MAETGIQNLIPPAKTNNHARESRGFNWFLYFCGTTANLLLLNTGVMIVWTSPLIPKLKSSDPAVNPLGIPITTIQVSTLAALPSISVCLSFIMISCLSNYIGRKKMLIGIAVGYVFNFTAVAFAKNIYIYFICAFLMGFCVSASFATVPIYNSEIAEDNSRGRLCCLVGIFAPIGELLGYFVGHFVNIKIFALIATIPSLLFLILVCFIPESPMFLAAKGQVSDCLKSLEKLRRSKNIEFEYDKIRNAMKQTETNARPSSFRIFKEHTSRKAFCLSLEICAVQQLTGVFVLGAFLAPIFDEAGGFLSGSSLGILSGVIQVIVCWIGILFIDRWGRRPLLLLSASICIFSLFLLGLYFHFKDKDPLLVVQIGWVPTLCITFFYIGFGFGLGPVPLLVMSELFSHELRAVGVSTVLIFHNLLTFAIVFSFPLISKGFGVQFCMWIFSILTFFGVLLVYFTFPETKGKSLGEIQNILAKKGEK